MWTCYRYWTIDGNFGSFMNKPSRVISASWHSFLHKCCMRSYNSENAFCSDFDYWNGPLVRYVKLWVAHVPRISGTFFPPPRVSHPDLHQGSSVTHVPWCMPGSLTSGFLWSQWWGNVPDIPGVNAACNITYLVRGPYNHITTFHMLRKLSCNDVNNLVIHVHHPIIVLLALLGVGRAVSRRSFHRRWMRTWLKFS